MRCNSCNSLTCPILTIWRDKCSSPGDDWEHPRTLDWEAWRLTRSTLTNFRLGLDAPTKWSKTMLAFNKVWCRTEGYFWGLFVKLLCWRTCLDFFGTMLGSRLWLNLTFRFFNWGKSRVLGGHLIILEYFDLVWSCDDFFVDTLQCADCRIIGGY